MAWRIRWQCGDQERTYALMRDKVAIWRDEDGAILLEAPEEGWQWATLVEGGEGGPVVRWHHRPEGVKLRSAGDGAVRDVKRKEWGIEAGDELWFEDTQTSLIVVSTSASMTGKVEYFRGPAPTGEVDAEAAPAFCSMYRGLAMGGGWQEVLAAVEEMAQRELAVEEVVGLGVLIWEGEEEFYHRVVWHREGEKVLASSIGGRARPGALASLLTREPELKAALVERGEVVLRRHQEGSADALLPIGDEQFLGAFYLVMRAEEEFEPRALWSLAQAFNPMGIDLVRRYRKEQELRNLEEENRYFRERERRHYLFKDLVCESEVMRQVYDELHERVEESGPIWMTGEAGTGKELLARALHHLGDRQEAMLIRMGCADFPEDLVDYELFGCVASELTGALAPRKGIFELAEGGTVFLDEIDRLSPMVQGKLVRVVQEREVRRIGDAVGRPVDARLIVSSHRDLEALCARGQFRRDLYELLAPHRMEVPSLRQRREDILPLAGIFLKKFAGRYDGRCQKLGKDLRQWMVSYSWPGNVRQLQTFIEAAVLMARDQEVIEEVSLMPEVAVEQG